MGTGSIHLTPLARIVLMILLAGYTSASLERKKPGTTEAAFKCRAAGFMK
jgi:hypothetical protein